MRHTHAGTTGHERPVPGRPATEDPHPGDRPQTARTRTGAPLYRSVSHFGSSAIPFSWDMVSAGVARVAGAC